MLFNSSSFLIFFPIVVLVYYLIPDRIKYLWLLGASYFYYMGWNAKYALLLLFSTVVTFTCGLLLDKIGERTRVQNHPLKKLVLATSLFLNLGILFYYKYINFAMNMLQKLFLTVHVQLNVPKFDILLPVGISFYTFQAIGYTIDVYREDIYAERNFFRYALFVSFFPQLVAGPIERSKNLLRQLAHNNRFDFEKVREGFLLMLWGYFLKIVAADRIAIFVDTIYADHTAYPGWFLIVAVLLCSFQPYYDFAGYTTIAMGAAKILGFSLVENFKAPYFARSVPEYWRRWHLSLTTWFTDYLYIPLGGSRKGTFRKYLNIMIVFLVSGLWHGADATYVIFGGLNGAYQVIGYITKPIRDKFVEIFRIHRENISHQVLQVLITFHLISFSIIFFRAVNLTDAITVIRSIFTANNPWILFDGSLYNCGLDQKNFVLMILCIVFIQFVDYFKYKGIVVRQVILQQDYWFRWLFIAVSISAILLLGLWGVAYNQQNFIYYQF
ncbi:MAG: MBOAT family protein [Oscillospiraceae bacterium]|nr:MBOAT family protein [Blautia sp.]MBR3000767.1 MBOAT family protein [Oscillospiraceae bacterium]